MEREARRACIGVLLLLITASVVPANAYPRPGRTALQFAGQSRTPMIGHRAHSFSDDFSLSRAGRFLAFESEATNLLPRPDLNPGINVFVSDRQKEKTELISRASDGTQGIGLCATPSQPTDPISDAEEGSNKPAISASGRFVAFASCATNLVSGDTNLREDIFVHDRDTGRTVRVSESSTGRQANSASSYPTISPDGRYVAFTSHASNLVRSDTNDVPDIFLHDLRRGSISRVSITSRGEQASNASYIPSLSNNARFIAFQSFASDLINQDTNGADDIFVHDRLTGKTELVSRTSTGALRNDPADRSALYFFRESISADGRFVLFGSSSRGMVPNDPNQVTDLFVRDRKKGRTERVSLTGSGSELEGRGLPPTSGLGEAALSAGGRFVAFDTTATNLAADDSETSALPLSGDQDVFIHDRFTGAVYIASANERGEDARCTTLPQGVSYGPAFSGDGKHVAFVSCGLNLDRADPRAPMDFPKQWQIFVRDQGHALGLQREVDPASPRHAASGTSLVRSDPIGDVLGGSTGTDIVGARFVVRPAHRDAYLKLDVDRGLNAAVGALVYGYRFRVGTAVYQVRAQAFAGSSVIGLFRCAQGLSGCTEVARLEGGFGTAGESVIASLPARHLTAGDAPASEIVAFVGRGSYLTGTIEVVDELPLHRAGTR